RFASLSLGLDYTCGLARDHTGYCWGSPIYAESPGGLINGSEPRPLVEAPLFQAISAGRGHTCGLSLDGDGYCWGANPSGQLGADADSTCTARFIVTPCRSRARKVVGGNKFLAISVGESHPLNTDVPPYAYTCGLTVKLVIMCWGGVP